MSVRNVSFAKSELIRELNDFRDASFGPLNKQWGPHDRFRHIIIKCAERLLQISAEDIRFYTRFCPTYWVPPGSKNVRVKIVSINPLTNMFFRCVDWPDWIEVGHDG